LIIDKLICFDFSHLQGETRVATRNKKQIQKTKTKKTKKNKKQNKNKKQKTKKIKK
jgi:hypothetical protein